MGEATASLQLTCGVEMELMLLQTDSNASPLGSDDGQYLLCRNPGINHLHKALSKPLPVECTTCKEPHYSEFRLPLNRVTTSSEVRRNPKYTRWTLTEDMSIQFSTDSVANFEDTLMTTLQYDMEIQSRIFAVPVSAGDCNSDAFLDHDVSPGNEIKAVCHQIRDTFIANDNSIRALVNRSCGIHVHIGNGNKGFPLQTLKNVFSLVVAHERQIDSFHAANRITGSDIALRTSDGDLQIARYSGNLIFKDAYNVPMSSLFLQNATAHRKGVRNILMDRFHGDVRILGYPENCLEQESKLVTAAKGNSVPSWIAMIQHAQCVKDLQQLQGAFCHESVLNLENLVDFAPEGPDERVPGNPKMTMEFRQHAGSLQGNEINAWVAVLVSLVEFAHATDANTIRQLCVKNWADPYYDGLDFLKTIGCSRKLRKWYKKKLGYQSQDASDYSSLIHEKEHQHIQRLDPRDPTKPLLSHYAKQRADRLSPAQNHLRTDRKFVECGYGQYPQEFLEKLELTISEIEQLTVRLPAVTPDPSSDFESLISSREPQEGDTRAPSSLVTPDDASEWESLISSEELNVSKKS